MHTFINPFHDLLTRQAGGFEGATPVLHTAALVGAPVVGKKSRRACVAWCVTRRRAEGKHNAEGEHIISKPERLAQIALQEWASVI